MAAAITPAITVVTAVNAGSVITGSSTGTLTLGTAVVPSGVRTVTGGTLRGGSPSFSLAALTFTGEAGHAFTISNAGSASSTLTGPSGRTMTVAYSSVVRTPAITSFPAGPAATSTTTATQYLGLTVQVKKTNLSATGTYTGSLRLRVTDSGNGLSATRTVPITIKVDPTAITLTKVTGMDLAFGAVVASGVLGTVVLAPGGSRTAYNGVSLGAFNGGNPARFAVTGALSALYGITLPGSVTLTAPTGGSLTVTDFTSSAGASGQLDASGQQTLNVGATLNVAANQPQGSYSGTFSVTTFYQ